jgi:hypothetical protein
MTRHELLTDQEMADLREIDVLLDEANDHALKGDGHCKSSEGHVSVSFGNHWERDTEETRKPAKVEIYSYRLGPHRSHYFDDTAQALEIVRQWHRREMAYDYDTHTLADDSESEPDLYLALEQKRQEEMDEGMRRFEEAMESGAVKVYTFGTGDESDEF